MIRKFFLLFLGLVLTANFVLGMEVKQVNSQDRLAPDFSLPDLKGKQVNLKNFTGRPVILFFWTTWCPYCRRELRVLSDMYDSLVDEGIVLLTVNGGESKEKVANFLKNNSFNFPVLLDADDAVSGLFEIWGVPTYVLIDKNGNIRFLHNYFPKETYKDLILK